MSAYPELIRNWNFGAIIIPVMNWSLVCVQINIILFRLYAISYVWYIIIQQKLILLPD